MAADNSQQQPPVDLSKYQSEQYRIDNMSYPSDLMDPQYGGNYVIFYVNVAYDSKTQKPRRYGNNEIVDDKFYTSDRGELIAQGYSNAGLVASSQAGPAIAGAVAGTSLIDKSKYKSKLVGNAVTALTGGALAAAPGAITLGVASTFAGGASRPVKRLRSAIALHVPNQLQVRYSSTWGEEDTAGATMAYDAVRSGGSAALKFLTGDFSGAKQAGAGIGAIIGNLGLSKAPGAAAISVNTGLTANPRKEQMFKGVDFRTFQFEYQFFPRDQKESRNVQEIIKMFKLHMHPEFADKNKYLYVYPSEFDISYYSNGSENTHIHKHTSCALIEMNVNYTPNSIFNTFPDGSPVQINVQLTFKELALLDKDKIEKGL
jgi:hypothetical protein